jgi:hypothetical protein
MDLQTVKAQYGVHWAWARTGALILFLLAGMLLAVSLSAARKTASADNPFPAGTDISALLHFHSAG